jgi:hypothetical protein
MHEGITGCDIRGEDGFFGEARTGLEDEGWHDGSYVAEKQEQDQVRTAGPSTSPLAVKLQEASLRMTLQCSVKVCVD